MTSLAGTLGGVVFCISLGGADLLEEYAVIVHADNDVKGFTSVEVGRIFKLETQRWKDEQETKIKLLLPKDKSDDMDFLLSDVYKMTDKELKKYWVERIYQNKIQKRPKQLPAGKIIVKAVSSFPDAMSVTKLKTVNKDSGVRIIPVDGKKPGDQDYPLTSDAVASLGIVPEIASMDVKLASARPAASTKLDDELLERLAAVEEGLLETQLGALTSDEGFSEGPRLSIKGFGHVQFAVHRDDTAGIDTTDDEFALGGVDLFVTSQLADNLSFLNETVFEPTDAGDYVLDVERVILKYEISDRLNIQAGRFHTTLGWWNENYHHGEWLQTSVGRPSVLNFEDEDGLLPVHLVGLVLKGNQDLNSGRIEYSVEVGNGRGTTPDPPQITIDANDAKAVNLAVAFSPASVQGLKAGVGVYSDRIVPNTDAAAGSLHGRIDELILSAFVTYMDSNWEFMAELFDIDHDMKGAGSVSSEGYYLQLGRKMMDWTPYVRYDATKLDDADTFFASVDDRSTIAAGLRWDYSDWSAIKLQYTTTDIDLATGGGSDDESAITLQVAFAF